MSAPKQVKIVCEGCGQEAIVNGNGTNKFCSRRCGERHRGAALRKRPVAKEVPLPYAIGRAVPVAAPNATPNQTPSAAPPALDSLQLELADNGLRLTVSRRGVTTQSVLSRADAIRLAKAISARYAL